MFSKNGLRIIFQWGRRSLTDRALTGPPGEADSEGRRRPAKSVQEARTKPRRNLQKGREAKQALSTQPSDEVSQRKEGNCSRQPSRVATGTLAGCSTTGTLDHLIQNFELSCCRLQAPLMAALISLLISPLLILPLLLLLLLLRPQEDGSKILLQVG